MTIEIECDDCDFKATTPADPGSPVPLELAIVVHAAETGHRGFGVLVLGDTGPRPAVPRAPAPEAGRLPL